jgi:uncharacterized protein (TIGR02246 family)
MSADEVQQAAGALVDAFANARVEEYFACFAADATFIFHPEPERLQSRDAYRTLWAQWERDDDFRVVSCASSGATVSMIGDDAAVFAHDVNTVVSAGGAQERVQERETIVFARRDGRWLAVHEHLSPRPAAD